MRAQDRTVPGTPAVEPARAPPGERPSGTSRPRSAASWCCRMPQLARPPRALPPGDGTAGAAAAPSPPPLRRPPSAVASEPPTLDPNPPAGSRPACALGDTAAHCSPKPPAWGPIPNPPAAPAGDAAAAGACRGVMLHRRSSGICGGSAAGAAAGHVPRAASDTCASAAGEPQAYPNPETWPNPEAWLARCACCAGGAARAWAAAGPRLEAAAGAASCARRGGAGWYLSTDSAQVRYPVSGLWWA